MRHIARPVTAALAGGLVWLFPFVGTLLVGGAVLRTSLVLAVPARRVAP